MIRACNNLLPLACAIALSACAHAPVPVVRAHPVWPAPPETPAVRWATSLPDPDAPLPRRSAWRRFWDVVLGIPAADRSTPPFDRPFGLAVDGEVLYVADPDAARVMRVAWRENKSTPITCAARAWQMPMAVAVGPDRALYVADAAAAVVVRVRANGCDELGRGAFERPTGLAFLGDRLYVVDPPRHAVVALGPDGREAQRFGGRGTAEGSLNFPTAITAVDGRSLLVVDSLNFRVCRFSANGALERCFGEPGDGGGSFGRPKAVTTDGRGRIWVSDAQHDVVIGFNQDGSFQFAIGAGSNQAPTGNSAGNSTGNSAGNSAGPVTEGRLSLPAGLASSGDRLFVADSYNHRVQVYELLGGAP